MRRIPMPDEGIETLFGSFDENLRHLESALGVTQKNREAADDVHRLHVSPFFISPGNPQGFALLRHEACRALPC